MRKVRKWKWIPFKNPARKDDAIFYHWRRVTDEQKEYPFAKFNKVCFWFVHCSFFCNCIFLECGCSDLYRCRVQQSLKK